MEAPRAGPCSLAASLSSPAGPRSVHSHPAGLVAYQRLALGHLHPGSAQCVCRVSYRSPTLVIVLGFRWLTAAP